MNKKSTVRKGLGAALFIGFSLLFIMLSFYFYQVFYAPNLMIRQEEGLLLIPKKEQLLANLSLQQQEAYAADSTAFLFKHQLMDSLVKYRYLQEPVSFSFVAKVLKYQDNIKPGLYKLTEDMTNLEAVRHLRSGAQEPVNVTFNNIRLKEELLEKATRNISATPEELRNLLSDPEVAARYGFDTLSIMTMFLPNTYQMYWTADAEQLLERMNREYERFWNEERQAKADELGMSRLEVAILASIVQAETQKPDEKPTVAGLYLNRLKRGMPLEADPTVKFALGDFKLRRILKKDLEIDSPYNTYKYAGLPPGPINLPAPSSIEAVLNAEQHGYLFMCAKEDFSGYHRFAKTYRQHINNARRYQRALNERGIMR